MNSSSIWRSLATIPRCRPCSCAPMALDFSAGGDLSEFGESTDLVRAHAIRTLRSPARLMHSLAARTTAFLHGACVGAGIEIPAAAGQVIAAPDTRFWLPELQMGLMPGAGGTVTIARRIGRRRMLFWALTGRQIDARTALDWGLVDEVRPVDAVRASRMSVAPAIHGAASRRWQRESASRESAIRGAAIRWAQSGLMSLTGPERGAPLVPAFDAMAGIDELMDELRIQCPRFRCAAGHRCQCARRSRASAEPAARRPARPVIAAAACSRRAMDGLH